MRVAGIDYSLENGLALVAIPYEAGSDEDLGLLTYPLLIPKGTPTPQRSLQAALDVPRRLTGIRAIEFFHNVRLVYIEQAFSQNRGTACALAGIAHAIAVSLPKTVRQEGSINFIRAQTWKAILTGRATASKEECRDCLRAMGYDLGRDTTLDCWDALGMAWAARTENEREVRVQGAAA